MYVDNVPFLFDPVFETTPANLATADLPLDEPMAPYQGSIKYVSFGYTITLIPAFHNMPWNDQVMMIRDFALYLKGLKNVKNRLYYERCLNGQVHFHGILNYPKNPKYKTVMGYKREFNKAIKNMGPQYGFCKLNPMYDEAGWIKYLSKGKRIL